jgi:hypothetical protein
MELMVQQALQVQMVYRVLKETQVLKVNLGCLEQMEQRAQLVQLVLMERLVLRARLAPTELLVLPEQMERME